MAYKFNQTQAFTFGLDGAPDHSKASLLKTTVYKFNKTSQYTFSADSVIVIDTTPTYPFKTSSYCTNVDVSARRFKVTASNINIAKIQPKVARSIVELATTLFNHIHTDSGNLSILNLHWCTQVDKAELHTKKIIADSGQLDDMLGHVCFTVDDATHLAKKEDIVLSKTALISARKWIDLDLVAATEHLVKKICYTSVKGKLILDHTCTKVDNAVRPNSGKSIIFTPPVTPINPIPPMAYTIPAKDSYITDYTISILVNGVDKTAAMTVTDFSAQLNAGMHSWAYTLSLAGNIDPALVDTGDIITVDLGVPTYVFKIYVEQISRKIKFTNGSVTISGRGLTAELASPIAASNNVTYGDPLTIEQLNGLQMPGGWNLIYSSLNWLIPEYTYAVENATPAATLLDLAEKTGNIVIPSKDSKNILIRERYPVKPWYYSDANVDFFIPKEAVDSYEISESLIIDADSIFIHGTGSGAVASQVKIFGQAGTKPLPTASNELITDANAARCLGGRLLSAAVDIAPITSIEIKGLDEIPIMLPSYTIKVAGIYGTINGYNLKISVTDGAVDTTTTLTIGETSNSVYSSFYDLIPQSPMLLGTVQNKDGINVRLTTLDGGSFVATGNAVVGNKYFVKQGIIVADAPTLTEVPVDV